MNPKQLRMVLRSTCDSTKYQAWREWELRTAMEVKKNSKQFGPLLEQQLFFRFEATLSRSLQELELCTSTVHREC
jgi:hypothetical protein